jgi:hypothetical protein
MKLPKQAASAVVQALSNEETRLLFDGFVAHCLEFVAGLAIGDDLAIERHLANATFPLSGGHADTRIIDNGLQSR